MSEKLKKKTFCKWGKENIKANVALIYELTARPKYVCENCARVAGRKTNLCKPHEFKRTEE
jgi:hypothetical protein